MSHEMQSQTPESVSEDYAAAGSEVDQVQPEKLPKLSIAAQLNAMRTRNPNFNIPLDERPDSDFVKPDQAGGETIDT